MNPRKKILMVDDDALFLRMVSERLNEEKIFEVITAIDGDKGLNLAEKEKPDLIMLDLIMPNMLGVDFLKKLRSKKDIDNTPVVIVTQLLDLKKISECTKFGIKGYIVKSSYTLDEMAQKIKDIVSQ